jgi:hypothetical protein
MFGLFYMLTENVLEKSSSRACIPCLCRVHISDLFALPLITQEPPKILLFYKITFYNHCNISPFL